MSERFIKLAHRRLNLVGRGGPIDLSPAESGADPLAISRCKDSGRSCTDPDDGVNSAWPGSSFSGPGRAIDAQIGSYVYPEPKATPSRYAPFPTPGRAKKILLLHRQVKFRRSVQGFWRISDGGVPTSLNLRRINRIPAVGCRVKDDAFQPCPIIRPGSASRKLLSNMTSYLRW